MRRLWCCHWSCRPNLSLSLLPRKPCVHAAGPPQTKDGFTTRSSALQPDFRENSSNSAQEVKTRASKPARQWFAGVASTTETALEAGEGEKEGGRAEDTGMGWERGRAETVIWRCSVGRRGMTGTRAAVIPRRAGRSAAPCPQSSRCPATPPSSPGRKVGRLGLATSQMSLELDAFCADVLSVCEDVVTFCDDVDCPDTQTSEKESPSSLFQSTSSLAQSPPSLFQTTSSLFQSLESQGRR